MGLCSSTSWGRGEMGVIYDLAYCVRTFLILLTLKTTYLLAHFSLLAKNTWTTCTKKVEHCTAVESESNTKHISTQNWAFGKNGEKL